MEENEQTNGSRNLYSDEQDEIVQGSTSSKLIMCSTADGQLASTQEHQRANQSITNEHPNLRQRTNFANPSSNAPSTDANHNYSSGEASMSRLDSQTGIEQQVQNAIPLSNLRVQVPPQLVDETRQNHEIPPTFLSEVSAGFTRSHIITLLASFMLFFAFFVVFAQLKTEIEIQKLRQNHPSPSPFTNLKQSIQKSVKPSKSYEQEESLLPYDPPSEELQKIPFLRKSEEEIYSDQVRSVLSNVKRVLNRIQAGNSTKLAGVVMLKPKKTETPKNDIQFKKHKFEEIDTSEIEEDEIDLEDELSSDDGPNDMVKNFVESLKTALSDVSKKISEMELEQSPASIIHLIHNYRTKNMTLERELILKLATISDELLHANLEKEMEDRLEERNLLLTQLIDYFFQVKTDDDALIEKAYHYSMSNEDKKSRLIRLDAAVFGPDELEIDELYEKNWIHENIGLIREEYVYDKTLATIVKKEEIHQFKNLKSNNDELMKRRRKSYYHEMKILLKLEKRIKGLLLEDVKGYSNASVPLS